MVITSTNNTGGGKWESRGVTGANGTIRFPSVAPGQVAVNVVYGNQTGSGYGYDVDNGEATMTVTLKTTVKKTFTLVYNDNGTEKPAANINFQVVGEGGPGTGHDFANGTTDANGVVTLNLTEGQPFYMYWASITVGGVTYTADGQANSIAALPSKIVMNVPPAP
ncbi:MAG: hypothetical protein BWY76_01224 [bacterium ADurb.Bin429]|nr:MAG: hypothetical protein BWY76_01224 [bacterium ADurb.Bin429]